MKSFISVLISLVMVMQGMQMAVAGVIGLPAAQTELSPQSQRAVEKFIDSVVLGGKGFKGGKVAQAQLIESATLPRNVTVYSLDTAGGLISAKWTAVPDAAEKQLGLKVAGTPLLVSSESARLNGKRRAELMKTPELTKRLFPGSQNGILSAGKQARITFQADEDLNLSGRVSPQIRHRATVVIEEASILADANLGPWFTSHTLIPDAKGAFSQNLQVQPGSSAVRARLDVRKNSSLPTSTAPVMTSASVATSSMPYNTFGITTPPWQVANNQGFDNNGHYYDSQQLGANIVWQGLTFPIGPVPNNKDQVGGDEGPKNVVHAAGQQITVPAGSYDWLYLAGAGANGNQLNQVITLGFTDGTTQLWTQSFTDWANNGTATLPVPFAGEFVLQEQSYWINKKGDTGPVSTYVYGYTYHLPANKTLATITLPNNNNLGILSIVEAKQVIPIDGSKAKSYLLGHVNLTGTDVVTMKIVNQQSNPLTFSMAGWPEDGCDPTTESIPCNYSTKNVVVNKGQTKTLTYIAPNNWDNIGFSMQQVAGGCVDNSNGCATYTPDWSNGVNGTNCSAVSPSPGESMEAGQTWTMTIQARADSAYNGFLYSAQVPNLQTSAKNQLQGCVFGLYTKFGTALSGQPGWAKWLEAAIGAVAIVGISLVTFGAPEEAAGIATAAAEAAEAGAAAEAGVDAVVVEEAVAALSTEESWAAALAELDLDPELELIDNPFVYDWEEALDR